ncbi:MAG: restriction endonuclease [Candidatus Moranbacteria bacterium]|nr:restriction endonuclease [Candidatus Moranbacteria bacterium]
MPEYLKKAFFAIFITAFSMLIFGYVIFAVVGAVAKNQTISYAVIGVVALWIFSYTYFEEITQGHEKTTLQLNGKITELEKEKERITSRATEIIDQLEKDKAIFKQALVEKNIGFPTLLKAIDEYTEAQDKLTEDYLKYKKHPSLKGSEAVKEQSIRRRQAEYDLRKTKAIIDYYESIAPFLIEYKEDIALPENEDLLAEYSEEEKLDPSVNFLTKQEYRSLSSIERNQMALDRFWKRPKSNWLLGRIYERYVGYIYEEKGYDVDYVGIFKGYEDLGRDLICTKKNEIVVIQCKNWSKFKTIYEKHIFQFFGTVFQYKDENKGKDVNAVFYTTTKLSDLARRFAKELGIGLEEELKMENHYPCIKCNISRVDGTKIYHLPFDQQYDKVKIEKKTGEFYCKLVEEAEEAGFRRAFRYKGLKKI